MQFNEEIFRCWVNCRTPLPHLPPFKRARFYAISTGNSVCTLCAARALFANFFRRLAITKFHLLRTSDLCSTGCIRPAKHRRVIGKLFLDECNTRKDTHVVQQLINTRKLTISELKAILGYFANFRVTFVLRNERLQKQICINEAVNISPSDWLS